MAEQLPDIDELGERIGLDNIVQAAWLLFGKDGTELTYGRRLGLVFFHMLKRLGYPSEQAAFIVTCTLPAVTLAVVTGISPAVVQLIDQVFVMCVGPENRLNEPQAWNLNTMKEVSWEDAPERPLISLAISLRELSRKSEAEGLLLSPTEEDIVLT